MNITSIYRHPAELEVEAMLSREQPYPDSFTPEDRIAERMSRVRMGLAHVMTEITPKLEPEQAEVINCWLDKIMALVNITLIDVSSEEKA
ncbi:nicotinic acetylcholine receptor subunit beta [Salmonella enterica subsp. enterica serovar Tennessee]